jgi:GT2 family glycosyltransferase
MTNGINLNKRKSWPYDISASIVSYDTNPSELLRALRSVTMCRLKTKVIVVENGITDRAKHAIVENGCEYRFVGRNVGFGVAHNLAICESAQESKYHLILNPDVYFQPNVLESLTEYMDANPQIGLAMPRILYPDGSQQYLCKLLPTPADLLLRRSLRGPLSKLLHHRTRKYEFRNVDPMRTLIVPV